MLDILAQHPPDLTAVFAVSDLMAIGGVMEAIRSIGKEVPHDIAVVGYDDIEAASFVRPFCPLCAKMVPKWAEGRYGSCWGLLTEPDAVPEKVLLPVELVIRESCGKNLGKQF